MIVNHDIAAIIRRTFSIPPLSIFDNGPADNARGRWEVRHGAAWLTIGCQRANSSQSTLQTSRLREIEVERDRCFRDRTTRVGFWNVNGELCGLLGLGSESDGTALTLPSCYVVSTALEGLWGKVSSDGKVFPLPSPPAALISSTGQRLFGHDFVGMWSHPRSEEQPLVCDGLAVFAATCENEVAEPGMSPNLDEIRTPPSPPMTD